MSNLYHFGYQGQHPELFEKALYRESAVCLDVRRTPVSKQPGWSWHELSARLGNAYKRCTEWGNVNYRNDEAVQIRDFEGGMQMLDDIIALDLSVCLLCRCSDFKTCHRHELVTRIANERGMLFSPLSLSATVQKVARQGALAI